MVRAILDGKKTQTRRVVKPLPSWQVHSVCEPSGAAAPWEVWFHLPETTRVGHLRKCPYGVPGDRLWVRETFWHQPEQHDSYPGMGSLKVCDDVTIYRADFDGDEDRSFAWRPSIFMPRWASRITLEIADVRVQRVQEISYRDSVAEGVSESPFAQTAFSRLWDSINSKRGHGSEKNDWVWALTFKRVQS